MEDYSKNELAEIRKKLSEIESKIEDFKEGGGSLQAESYQDLTARYDDLAEKIEDISKKQATTLKILTVIQQQSSGLKVALNNLEDMMEGEDTEKAPRGSRKKGIPEKSSSGKIFKYFMGFVIIVIAFIMVNRWITAYLNRNWSPHSKNVPGIYESLETAGSESGRSIPEPSRPYADDIQSKIDEKLDAIVPKSEAEQSDEVIHSETLPISGEIIDIFVPRVLILNGCGVSGIAARLSQHLTRNGIRVVDSKNADNFNYPLTIVYSTSDNPQDHIWLELIGLRPNTVKPLNNERDNANTVIILGKDYRTLSIF